MACRIFVPQPGISLDAQQWKRGVLTTGPSGNYQQNIFLVQTIEISRNENIIVETNITDGQTL